jgi:hypothetical protein
MIQALAERMKKANCIAIVTSVVVLALPLVFVALTQRTDHGAVSTYTLRFTQCRMFFSDSGNAHLTRQATSAPPKQIAWSVTRKNRVIWRGLNMTMLYLDSPRFLRGTST